MYSVSTSEARSVPAESCEKILPLTARLLLSRAVLNEATISSRPVDPGRWFHDDLRETAKSTTLPVPEIMALSTFTSGRLPEIRINASTQVIPSRAEYTIVECAEFPEHGQFVSACLIPIRAVLHAFTALLIPRKCPRTFIKAAFMGSTKWLQAAQGWRSTSPLLSLCRVSLRGAS